MNDTAAALSKQQQPSTNKYDLDLELQNNNALSVIIDRIKPNSRVLEFGPANGRLSKHLAEKMQCTVYAVEIDQDVAEQAKQFCEQLIVGDIEDFTWFEAFNKQQFDVIIFADVLEHLKKPELVLAKAKELISADGEILLSIPNITHNSVLIDLLNDQFTYTKTGLLDNTHLRFFA